MEISITYHAVERFRQRIALGLSFDAARECLQSATRGATQLREKSVDGHSLWAALGPAKCSNETLQEAKYTEARCLLALLDAGVDAKNT